MNTEKLLKHLNKELADAETYLDEMREQRFMITVAVQEEQVQTLQAIIRFVQTA